jgi:predicted DNA-binding antitoxin AbrB/MazE fold protein
MINLFWEGEKVVIEQKKRQQRSDKKRDVKPTIPTKLRECIYRLSYITDTPVKDIAEALCESGLHSKKVIELLSAKFRRDYRKENTFYLGDLSRPSLQKSIIAGDKVRITIRFNQTTYEQINSLAYALDVTVSKATFLLLDASVRNTNFLNRYVKESLRTHLDESRMRELRQILKFINESNPYEEKITWMGFISYLYQEFKGSGKNVSQSIIDWLEEQK